MLNSACDPHFRSEDLVDIETLVELAKQQEQLVREKGADWTAGGVSFWGSEVTKAVDTGEHADVSKAIFSMLKATCLFDSVFIGISRDTYLTSDMELTIAANGAVMHKRVPVVPG